MRNRLVALAALPLTFLLASAAAAQTFVNYESGPVRAIAVSADGSRLYVADTVGGHLNVFDLADARTPVLVAEIPVGIDPVSVHPRTRDEVWVANLLSDSVSIVSVAMRAVVATLRVSDEPSDIVFANGRAFVTAAASDEVRVFDAVTRAPVGAIAIFGKDPRALAVSPAGDRVYAVVQRSGNGTTVVPEFFAPAPPPPTNSALPAAPSQGIIIRADDPAWAVAIPYSLPDHDVAEIDAAALAVTRYFDEVGTTNTGIAVHPTTGDLWVANTQARNLVRFEPNLRGHAIDSRVTKITTGAGPTVTAYDLNPNVNYNTLPNPSALMTALAEPFGLAIDGAAGKVYVAAQGTDRIGVLDLAGNVTARIELGSVASTRDKRGPRALALHPSDTVLYVLNRLSDTLSVVDTAAASVLAELPIATWDPMPQLMREGRKFLYDSKLSGNGTMSCASCHIDGDIDGLAWDLGDRGGSMANAPSQPAPFNIGLTQFHPMKGPMTTQTLRGLAGTGPLHWRGDRADFQAFNGAFDALMGGAVLSTADMDDFAAFGNAIAMPPNPNQLLDRSLRTLPANNNEAAGLTAFQALVANVPIVGQVGCVSCHSMPAGTVGFVIGPQVLSSPQQAKVPHLRNLYRKVGFTRAAAPQKSGFGFTHDGIVDTLDAFIQLSQFNTWPSHTKDDIVTFLMSFDTGTAPTVGYTATMTASNAQSAALVSDLALLMARAVAGDIDLIATGLIDGRMAGLVFDTAAGHFVSDLSTEGPFTQAQLQAKAAASDALLSFMGVAPGSGERLARDRDLDSVADGDEAASRYGNETPGCSGALSHLANSQPRTGNGMFALTVEGAPATAAGFQMFGFAMASLPVAGVELLVDPTTAVPILRVSDAYGGAQLPFPIPAQASYAGLALFSQVGWLDPCGPLGVSSSRGLAFTIVP